MEKLSEPLTKVGERENKKKKICKAALYVCSFADVDRHFQKESTQTTNKQQQKQERGKRSLNTGVEEFNVIQNNGNEVQENTFRATQNI